MSGGLNARTEAMLERVRSIFGRENVIGISGRRNGSGRSAHDHGDAFDFSVRNGNGLLTSREIAQRLLNAGVSDFDQLIYYNGSTHVHLGLQSRHGVRGEILEATKRGGTTSYAKRVAGDLVDVAKDKGRKAIAGAIDGFVKGGGNPVTAAIGGAKGLLGIGGGGDDGFSLNPFKWLVDYLKEASFFSRAAMVLVGIVLVIAALGWLGKSKLPVGKVFEGAKRGIAK